MKEFTVIIKDEKSTWEEGWCVPENVDVEEFVSKEINDFNKERGYSRSFVGIKRKRSIDMKQTHNWDKVSLVTERGGFDKMKCTICGATGKRFGLGQNGIRVDSKFDPKYCKKR